MKEYVKPVVLESAEMTEGVFANSWSGEELTWTIELYWTNQDSGSLSCLHGYLHGPNKAGTYAILQLTWNGNGDFTCGEIQGGSFNGGGKKEGKVITFVHNGNYNANETFSFSINNAVFDSTGDNHTDPEGHVGSYYLRDTHMGESALDVFGVWADFK